MKEVKLNLFNYFIYRIKHRFIKSPFKNKPYSFFCGKPIILIIGIQ